MLPGVTTRAVPWWMSLGLGVACIAVGVLLVAWPSRSLSLLVWLVATGLLLSGVSGLLTASVSPRPRLARGIGILWLLTAVVAIGWPGVTLWALAIAVAVGLIAGGCLKVVTALSSEGEDRFILGLSGLTNVVVGVLAVTWPSVTVLALAIIFGVRMIVTGVSDVMLGLRSRRDLGDVGPRPVRRHRSVRLVGAVVGLALALGGAVVSASIRGAQPDDPPAFYTAPSPLPDGPPGTILRTEVINGYLEGATTYRVLYTSTNLEGEPTAVSGIIAVPDTPAPQGGRRVLTFTHGTVGVTPRCAPSLRSVEQTPLGIEGGPAFIAAGYVVAATDYQGLGTAGTHPYLVGEVEAMNALDIIRAARNLEGVAAGSEFAVWGHSQGGHASLFTGEVASGYAPELDLVGVAAGGPVPDLVELFEVNIGTRVGKILIAMALYAWSETFEVDLGTVVTPTALPVVGKIAQNCLYGPGQLLGSLPGALILDLTFVSGRPWELEPWTSIIADNNPGQVPTDAPMLIVQSDADTIVAPDVTRRFVEQLCADGATVELMELQGVSHLDTGAEAAPDVLSWINDRFKGLKPSTTCG